MLSSDGSRGAQLPAAAPGQTETISLTPTEDILCRMLEATCAWLASGRYQPSEETLQAVNASAFKPNSTEPCIARLAGGWVRDKLLNVDSADVDVSLSTYTGFPFALGLTAFLGSKEFQESQLAVEALNIAKTLHPSTENEEDSASTKVMGNIGRIKANPDQSKNLETATAELLGLSMDFVNLRKEVYEEGSRIPVMTFGTPKEDAERRDLTINSLLFNVHTRLVEDFTGKGLSDLRNGLVRTPLPPLRTFLDDPLRVLRCVRFASRFGYRLHQDIIQVLTDHHYAVTRDDELSEEGFSTQDDAVRKRNRLEVVEALQHKVSRERFGMEVDKMMTGPNPLLALYLLSRFELFPLVFQPIPGTKLFDADSTSVKFGPAEQALRAARLVDAIWKTSAAVDADGDASMTSAAPDAATELSPGSVNAIPAPPLPPSVLSKISRELLDVLQSRENRRRLFFAAALLPIRHVLTEEKKGKPVWSGENVLEKGLKLSNKTRDSVASIMKGAAMLSHPALEAFDPLAERSPARQGIWPDGSSRLVAVGLLLQHPFITNPALNLSLPAVQLFALVSDLLELFDSKEPLQDDSQIDEAAALAVIETHAAFSSWTRASGLATRAQERPRLNGNEIQETLGFHPGAMTSRISDAVMAWQLDRPAVEGGSEAERESVRECREWLKDSWEAGKIIPMDQRIAPKAGKKKVKGKQDGPATKRQKSEEK